MGIVPDLLKAGVKVVDLSADFRFQDVKRYEAHYQPHSAADLLPQAVYGLSEIFGAKIGSADLVGNPGCYPTSVLLPLIPLLRSNLIEPETIIADSKSGVSGAGRSATLTAHFCQVTESFKAYKVACHRHNPEMDEILSRQANSSIHITFVPHLVPMTRGMESTIYTGLRPGVTEKDIHRCLTSFYNAKPFVRIKAGNQVPDSLNVRGTNYCDIGFRVDANNRRLILLSVIDNLIKGAAGQAVQNMNLMFGLNETAGLEAIPFPL
jgi:N-acetyl-gamma-glutamyl-phosphate reductase